MTKQKINGVLLLDKPLGISSSKAGLIVKRLFNAEKAGHTGSLDVLASGLLPICLGEATKFSQVMLDADKQYSAEVELGKRTTTCDSEGEVIATGDVSPISREQVEAVIKQFQGEITQIPSMYSALKHHGQPLYKLARAGKPAVKKPRQVTIYSCEINEFNPPQLSITVHSSKGTYIRNLVDDIGERLGCYAYVKSLRRLGSAYFDLKNAVTLEQLEAMNDAERLACLLPVECLLKKFTRVNLSVQQAERLQMGQLVTLNEVLADELIRVYSDDQLIGLVTVNGNEMKVKRLLQKN